MSRLQDWLGRSLQAIKLNTSTRDELGSWLRNRGFLFWSAIAILGVFLAALLAPESKTLTSFEGRTESFSYWPGNTDGFYLEFDQAWVERGKLPNGSASTFEGRCSAGLVLTGDPGKLQIERLHNDLQTLIISTEAGTKVALTSNGLPEGELVEGPIFIHLRGSSGSKRTCSNTSVVRMPIEGLIQVGGENADETGKLLNGALTIFGRADPGILSILAGGSGASTDTIIYSAGTLELPVGSRVGNGTASDLANDQSNHWTGFIEADLDSAEPGFSANLQTIASEVRVWNQAADATRPDKISMGLTARLAGDPYLQWFVGIFAASLALIGIMANRFPVKGE